MTIQLTITYNYQTDTVIKLNGTEALSKPFRFDLSFISSLSLDEAQLLGQIVTLHFYKNGKLLRKITGIITESALETYLPNEQKMISIRLSPKISLLKEFKAPRTFYHKTIIDITKELLTQHAKYSYTQIKWQIHDHDEKIPFILQGQQENDIDFLHRLLDKTGIFYWFDQDNILFCNQNISLNVRQHPLIYKTNYGMEDHHAIYALKTHHHSITDQFILRDYNENIPDTAIFAKENTNKHKSPQTIKDIYGMGIKTIKEASNLAKQYKRRAKIDAFQLIAHSHCLDLFPGLRIDLHADDWDNKLNDRYVITEINHYFEQNIPYQNQVQFIPDDIPYTAPIPDHPQTPSTWEATVEGWDTHAHLDEEGRYYIRYHFDESPPEKKPPPIRKLLSYGGLPGINGPTGSHFPLQNGSSVLIHCLHGDPNRPYILATLPNTDHLSPVTSKNSTQNRLKTQSGNEWILEDDPGTSYIALRTPNLENELRMASNPNTQEMTLTTTKGAFHLYAKKNYHQTTKANLEETIQSNRYHTISGKHLTHIKNGSLNHQAKRDTRLQTRKNGLLKSDQEAEIGSGKHLKCIALNTKIKAPKITLHSRKSRLNIKGESTTFKSDGPIHLHVNGAGILMNPNGTITLYGQSISGNINYNGHITENLSPTITPHAPNIKDVPFNTPIPNLTIHTDRIIERLSWEKTSATIQETMTANFIAKNFKGGEEGLVNIYAINPRSNEKTQIEKIPFVIEKSERLIQLQIPWHPKTSMEEEKTSYTFQTIPTDIKKLNPTRYTFDVTIENHSTQENMTPLVLTTELTLTFTYTDGTPLPDGSWIELVDSQAHLHTSYTHQGKVHFFDIALGECWILAKRIVQDPLHPEEPNYQTAELLNDQNTLPYYGGLLTPSLKPNATNTYTITVLPPLLICNIREETHTWNSKQPLDKDSIQMIKQNGNNTTLFIHGYNTALGQCGKYYNDVDTSFCLNGTPSPIDCTVYRDPKTLSARFQALTLTQPHHENLKTDGTLNGEAFHQWAICMEHNLNTAAGFDQSSYEKYARLLHITWSGNLGELNFIEAVKHTAKAGKRLATLIRYLKSSGIQTINIIAHSLGNEVLLVAMQELGRYHQTLIDHTFLWEAAVPNDALSNKPKYYPRPHHPLTENETEITDDDINTALWYDFPKAHLAAQKITILYSNNDNVLGPFPDQATQDKNGLDQHEINKAKPFKGEYLPAKLLMDAGWHSSFELATWLKVNPEDLLNPTMQDTVYQNFVFMHKTEISRITGKPFEKTLDEAIEARKSYNRPFKNRLKMEGPINRLTDLMILLNHDFGFHPKPALGYRGPDEHTRNLLKNKLYEVPQHRWLWSHSGMKFPTQFLMDEIYKKWIINKQFGIKQLGRIIL